MLREFNLMGYQEDTRTVPANELAQLELKSQIKKLQGTAHGKIEHVLNELKNKEALIAINAHRGRRLKMGYPANGQRTRTNAKTAKKFKLVTTIKTQKRKKQ